MLSKALVEILQATEWQDLDYLVVDMHLVLVIFS